LVQEPIEAWLEEHKTELEAQFVFKAWLDAGGEKELVQEPIEAWLEEHKTELEAQFVFKAWLDAGGEKELVQEPIEAWLEEHKTELEAQFVFKAWLDAGGEKELVQEPIEAWLEEHKTELEAQFVFKAWLDAGGEKELVQEPIEAWLEEHKTELEAGFVYNSWLKASGSTEMILEYMMAWLEKHCEDINACFIYDAWIERDKDFSVIGSYAIQWLSRNRDKAEAVYLTKFLAKQRGITVGTVKDILMWCQSFPDDGLWRLTQLKINLYNEELGEEVVNTSETVLRPLILHGYPIPSVIKEQIPSLFSYLISAPKLRFGQLRTRVDMLLMIWLRNPASFGSDINPNINLQRWSYFQRIIDLIVSEDLDVVADRKAIERFLYWVNSWEPKRKSKLLKKITLNQDCGTSLILGEI
ncbi:MAG: hypothetical protein K8R34_15295, partial [Methanosarcinales archaeon]|nr:hypothetical protein [Methanosarcinales archaeon]